VQYAIQLEINHAIVLIQLMEIRIDYANLNQSPQNYVSQDHAVQMQIVMLQVIKKNAIVNLVILVTHIQDV
jgi:hypothetical protein